MTASFTCSPAEVDCTRIEHVGAAHASRGNERKSRRSSKLLELHVAKRGPQRGGNLISQLGFTEPVKTAMLFVISVMRVLLRNFSILRPFRRRNACCF